MTVAAAALASVAFGGLSLASAESTSDPTMRTLHVLEFETGSHFVDVDGNGFGPGDEVTFTSRLRNLANTRTVGHTSVVCVATLHERADCNGTAWLRGGTIRV